MAALKVESLSFRYPGGTSAVLDDVTLVIPEGGIFGLLGPNGAGKTTLISLLAGQLRGAGGHITLDSEPLEAARRRRPHSLGLVPQEHAFYPMLSCIENLRFFGGAQEITGARLRERIDAVATFARIEAVLRRPAGQLSGGLKRRLNLAIGLLTDPEILLLDEPTVGVDPQSRAFLLESIGSLAGPGRIILYTSHYMEEVQAICDHAAIMDRGRVLVSGELDKILHDDSGVLRLHLRDPLPESLAAEWRARYALREHDHSHYSLNIPQTASVAELLGAVQAAGCAPISVTYGQRDLEHLFMQLTQRSLRD